MERRSKLQKLLADSNAQEAEDIQELVVEFDEEFEELDAGAGDFFYDGLYECTEFSKKIEPLVTAILLSMDDELNQIIDTMVQEKLAPVMALLEKQLNESGKKIDELLVKVAEFHKTLDGISEKATQISEKITTSYSTLALINEEFAEKKIQIESAKSRILPLAEEVMKTMQENTCVAESERERVVQKLGDIASIHWLGDKADEIERRLNVLIAGCRAEDVSAETIDAFMKNVDENAISNAQMSYSDGLTFDPTVPTHEWYYPAFQSAHERGYVAQGRPGDRARAQEALLMILRASGAGGFSDTCQLKAPGVANVSPYAVCGVNYGFEKGIQLNTDMVQPITRARVARWLTSLIKVESSGAETAPDLSKYADLKNVSGAERSAIASVVSNGLMIGSTPDGTVWYFKPGETLSRAELVAILERVGSFTNQLPQ